MARNPRKKKENAGELPAVFTGLRRGTGVAPSAAVRRFPAPEQIAGNPALRFDWPNSDGKIFLGLANADVRQVELPDGRRASVATGGDLVGLADDRHLCTVAGNRAGKGRSLLINNLLTYPGSVLVIDPKGDLAVETANHREEVLGQKVFVLDPFSAATGIKGELRVSFNPLQWIDPSDVDGMIMAASLIADALVVVSSERDPHWAETAKQFLEAVILHVCTAPEYEGRRTLKTVNQIVMVDVESDEFAKRMGSSEAANGAVVMGAIGYYSKSEKERSGVISTLRRHVHFLKYGQMQEVLDNGPFDLGILQREPTTLYLSLPAMHMGNCAGWLRLFVNLALNAFEANEKRREFQHQRGGHRVLMILDEANVLGHMQRLEAAIGQIAGLGVKLWTIWQDLGQAAATYGKRWESFLGNASAQIYFGNTDQFTLDYIERRLGSTLVYSPSHHAPTLDAAKHHGESGRSFSVQSHPLMTAAEIAEFFDRDDPMLRELVFLPRIGPVILQRAYYDQHEFFQRIRDQS